MAEETQRHRFRLLHRFGTNREKRQPSPPREYDVSREYGFSNTSAQSQPGRASPPPPLRQVEIAPQSMAARASPPPPLQQVRITSQSMQARASPPPPLQQARIAPPSMPARAPPSPPPLPQSKHIQESQQKYANMLEFPSSPVYELSAVNEIEPVSKPGQPFEQRQQQRQPQPPSGNNYDLTGSNTTAMNEVNYLLPDGMAYQQPRIPLGYQSQITQMREDGPPNGVQLDQNRRLQEPNTVGINTGQRLDKAQESLQQTPEPFQPLQPYHYYNPLARSSPVLQSERNARLDRLEQHLDQEDFDFQASRNSENYHATNTRNANNLHVMGSAALAQGGSEQLDATSLHKESNHLPFRSRLFPPGDTSLPERNPSPRSVSERSGTTFTRSTYSGARAVRVKNYNYDPLDQTQIRLVKIQAEKGWKVKCEVFPVSLEHMPTSYVAISYAWGDVDQKSEIILEREVTDDAGRTTIERTPHRVTASLHGALEAVREKGRDVWVWVDALCINQDDVAERTRQVQSMTDIYSKAESVAIWLGPEENDSEIALGVLKDLDNSEVARARLRTLIGSIYGGAELRSIVALFERDYWDRLWVVQEVFNARHKTVYCGSAKMPWQAFEIASKIFFENKALLDQHFAGKESRTKRINVALSNFTSSQILVYQGPSSLPDVETLMKLENPLLEIMRACRRKLTAKPQDKVFGILGVLLEETRIEFIVDYSLSIKEVYISVVDFVLSTSRRLDIIRESIHFPMHTGSAGLPTWCPDWSHIPDTKSLGRSQNYPKFNASKDEDAIYKPADEHRKLEVSAIYIGTIRKRGIAVGTLTTLADHLMAFLHWRAILLDVLGVNVLDHQHPVQMAFCRTLCLDQIPTGWEIPQIYTAEMWVRACFHVFSSLLRERLPALPIDEGLQRYILDDEFVGTAERRQFLHKHFACNMMGRCFMLTEDGHMGLGSGFMAVDDVVVVPLGCDTPIIIRQEGRKKEYRYVGDVYVDSFMMGEAVEQWRSGQKELRKYTLH